MDKKTVSELKKILTDRGIPCNGKLRAELVTLAQKAVKLYREREGCDHETSLAVSILSIAVVGRSSPMRPKLFQKKYLG